MNLRRYAAAALLALCASPPEAVPQGPPPASEWTVPTITDNTTWSGTIVLRQTVVVAERAVLRVLPGTTVLVTPGRGIALTVLGRLVVEGGAARPATFAPEAASGSRAAWEGIRLGNDGGGRHVLDGFRVEGAREGVGVTEATAAVSRGAFSACETGLKAYQKSSVSIDNCVFEGSDAGAVFHLGGSASLRDCRFENILKVGLVADKGSAVRVSSSRFSRGKTGIMFLTNAPCAVDNCDFSSLETGIVARQTGRDSAVTRCAFENNASGLLAVQFCFLEVADSAFRGNQTALEARDFSTPLVHHNRFEANQAAVSLARKSHARVERNLFRHNRNGIVVNYSSYPRIAWNNFDRNDMAVRLEKFQSGDWEERAGSREITAGEAARRGSRAMPRDGRPPDFPKRVNAMGNYWGPDAARDPAAGTLGNIWDGKKAGPVKYDGFGDAEYRLDVVDFSGEEAAPVADAGPRPATRSGDGGQAPPGAPAPDGAGK